jgi:coenzyme F420 hydrogenase subunit beta
MGSSEIKSATVRRVLRGELCTGCGLCASVSEGAIRMTEQAPGYARPEATGAPMPEGAERRIADACPGARIEPWADKAEVVDPYWGPLRTVATGAATDPKTRYEGSSGGAVSALAIHALTTGMVDRVVHVGADPEAPTRNVTVISRTPEDVIARAGSRYTASSPLAGIIEAAAEGGRMAFIGKPCDVSALRRLARQDAKLAAAVPVMLSFFCAGIPSHGGVGRILAQLGVEADEVTAFRYRGRGWPGMCAAETKDGRTTEMTYAESWGGHLSKEVQFRCKICPDAVGGVADVACADAWYGDEDGYPAFEEAEGRSLVIARTEVGQRLLESAVEAGEMEVTPLDPSEIDRMQPGQTRRKRLVLARSLSLPMALQPVPAMSGLMVARAARRASLREAAQNLLGTLRRTLIGRRSRL